MNVYREKALQLAEKGYTPIPLNGKAPLVKDWQKLKGVTADQIHEWDRAGLWRNIGMSCGVNSNNVVVIDFDGIAGYDLFVKQFPELENTLTVKTGSGNGMHCYYTVDLLPDSRGVMDIPIPDTGELVNIEFKSDGKQVVTPPSKHPETGNEYTTVKRVPILKISDLARVWEWAKSLKPNQTWDAPKNYSIEKNLNPKLLSAIQTTLEARGYSRHGEWINVSCPNTVQHKHGDRTPSFGFNTVDGGANCYVCGGMSLKELCGYIGINPLDYGGIYEKSEHFDIRQASPRVSPPARVQEVQLNPMPVVTRSSRIGSYIDRITDYDQKRDWTPIPFPFRALHKFGGLARVSRPGKLMGLVGVSGGGKTSLLETLIDGWLTLNIPCLVWSPEWTPDEFIERSIQRYGGPTMEETYLHEIWIDEQQRGIKSGGVGAELPATKIRTMTDAIHKMQSWSTEVGYLDMPMLTLGYLQEAIPATLEKLEFKPRVLAIDYVQLLHALEPDHDVTMYHLLMRLKAICQQHKLLGVIATQVTKDSARRQVDGQVMDGMAARYVNDDAFNLFITINPDRNSDGQFQDSAVLNVAKNSAGQRGKIRVPVAWDHMIFGDRPHQNQEFGNE